MTNTRLSPKVTRNDAAKAAGCFLVIVRHVAIRLVFSVYREIWGAMSSTNGCLHRRVMSRWCWRAQTATRTWVLEQKRDASKALTHLQGCSAAAQTIAILFQVNRAPRAMVQEVRQASFSDIRSRDALSMFSRRVIPRSIVRQQPAFGGATSRHLEKTMS